MLKKDLMNLTKVSIRCLSLEAKRPLKVWMELVYTTDKNNNLFLSSLEVYGEIIKEVIH